MALSQGKYPTAYSVVNAGDVSWTNPTNLYLNDNNYASVTLNAGQTSDTIRLSGFGFDAMADTDEIVSIYAYIYCYTTTGTAITLYEEIYGPTSGGSSTGYNDPVTHTAEATEYAGSSTGDTWGLALTASEVKNSSFGLDLYVTNGAGGVTETFYVDTVYVLAYYGKSPAIKNIQTTTPSAGTSHVMAMPSGASAPALNDCLVLLVAANLASDSTNELISISSGGAGWLKMFEHGSASTGVRIAGFIKNQYNDLGEGDVTIATSASCTTIGHYMTVDNVCSYYFLDAVCNPVKKIGGTNIVVNGKNFNSTVDFKTTIAFAAFEGNTSGCATSGTGYAEKVDTQVTGLSTVVAERSLFDNTTTIPDVTFTPTTNYDGIGISITLVGNYNHTNSVFIDSYPDWRDGFQSRSKITISQDMVSGTANLTNFPVMLVNENLPVNLFNTSDTFDTYDTSGDDILFTSDPEGNEIIPHCFLEVTKAAEPTAPIIGVFVRVPTLYYNQDTEIYVWYDSASAVIANSGGEINSTVLPSQQRLTWYDYEFVFNYYLYDQGMKYHSPFNSGTISTNQTDPWGLSKATYYAGTDDYIRVDPHGSGFDFGDGDWFLQCWANPDTNPVSEMMICVQNPDTSEGAVENIGDQGGFALMISSDGKYGVCGDVANGGSWDNNYNSNIKGPAVNPTAEVFECVVGKFSSGVANAVYVNGTKYQNAHTQSWFVSTQNDAFTLGANSYVSGPAFDYAGDLIMCRLRKGGMTDDWIATEYANQSDPSYITGGPHGSSAVLEQEGFRFRNDDGTEATATWIAAQDTNITRSKNVNTRLRAIATWDIGYGVGNRLRLEYRKVGDPDTEWRPIE